MNRRRASWLLYWLAAGVLVLAYGRLTALEHEDQERAAEHAAETLYAAERRERDERTQALIDAAMARYKQSPEGREAVYLTYPVGDVAYRASNERK
jgi:hypothetical protein